MAVLALRNSKTMNTDVATKLSSYSPTNKFSHSTARPLIAARLHCSLVPLNFLGATPLRKSSSISSKLRPLVSG